MLSYNDLLLSCRAPANSIGTLTFRGPIFVQARSSDNLTERLADAFGREQSVEQPASGALGFGRPASLSASLSAAPSPGQQFFHQQQAQPPQQQQQLQAQDSNGFVQQLQQQQSFQNGAAAPDLRAGSMSSGEFYGAADNGSGRHSNGSGGPAPATEVTPSCPFPILSGGQAWRPPAARQPHQVAAPQVEAGSITSCMPLSDIIIAGRLTLSLVVFDPSLRASRHTQAAV